MGVVRREERVPVLTLFVIILILLKWQPVNAGEYSGAEGISVKDFRNKEVRVEKPVKRIVCLIESALTGLYMLGVEDRVVGVSTNVYGGSVYRHYAAIDERIRARKLPAPGNWDFVNVETVISLRPDLVIVWAQQSESIKVLEEKGIAVYGVFISKKEDVYQEIQAFGQLTGRAERAEQLIRYTQKEISAIEGRVKKIPASRRPSVYYMWAQGNLETSCGGSTVNDLIDLAGGKNVCGHIRREHAVVNMENLLTWNPDVVAMWYNDKQDPSDILNDPRWRTLKAVKAGRVYEFSDVFYHDLWTLKFQYAVKTAAQWFHPHVFKHIDLERERKEMWRHLYGRNTDVVVGRKQ